MITAGTYLGLVGAVIILIWFVTAAVKISRDHCRDYDPRTARAGPTAVYPNPPIVWWLIATSSIVIGEGWLNTRSGNDYLMTGRTFLGSIVAVM